VTGKHGHAATRTGCGGAFELPAPSWNRRTTQAITDIVLPRRSFS
jgi:hypothetical protein